jgi:site-specific DNA-methyltransferase (adenine-specific)
MSSGCITPFDRRGVVPAPYFDRNGVTLYQGDVLSIVPSLPTGSVDALVTDPPYSSGGMTTGERSRDPAEKYCQNGNTVGRPSFEGDCRDQRSFLAWSTLWLSAARRVVRSTGYALVFTDWRQLPITTDALQAAGLTWRGIVAWDKGRGSRAPHKGFIRHQCEYVAWGTNGRVPQRTDAGPFDGCHHVPHVLADKHHMTGKPVELMKRLIEVVPEGGTVLDCFGGSGTTAVACAMTGRRCILIEQSEAYCEVTAKRLEGL